jgi:hypothetical protein
VQIGLVRSGHAVTQITNTALEWMDSAGDTSSSAARLLGAVSPWHGGSAVVRNPHPPSEWLLSARGWFLASGCKIAWFPRSGYGLARLSRSTANQNGPLARTSGWYGHFLLFELRTGIIPSLGFTSSMVLSLKA